MEDILNKYYEHNAYRLRKLVKDILSDIKVTWLSDKDMDDFYSLANEVFADIIRKYDVLQSFEGYLYSCLSNRIKTEITRRNRDKRKADRLSVSIDAPVSNKKSVTLGDVIADSFNMEKEIVSGKEEEYSKRMILYLNRLSDTQKSILMLSADGYKPAEIIKELNISKKQYNDSFLVIRAYRNVSVLF